MKKADLAQWDFTDIFSSFSKKDILVATLLLICRAEGTGFVKYEGIIIPKFRAS